MALFAVGEQALHVLVSPYLAEGLGQGTGVIGVVLAVFGGASLLSRVPVGAIYRFDRALPMLVAGGLLCTLAFAFVPLVGHPVPFAGLMALDGLGWAIVTTTQLALLVATRPAGLPTAAAMAWYSGSQGIGNALGGVSAGFLADTFGYAPAFLALAAIPLIATLVMVRAFRRQSRAGLVNAPQTDGLSPRGHAGILRAIRGMPPIVWAGVVIMVYINFMSGLLNTIHPVFALAAGLSLTQIGTLASCRSIASSVVRFASGPIFSRTDRRVSLTFPLAVLSASAVVLLPSVPSSFLLQIPLFLMVGLSRGLLRITGSADAFDGVADDERAHGMTAAVLHGGLDLGKIVGPALGGGVASVIGLSATFRVLPVALLTLYLVLVTAARRREAGGLAADEPQPQ
ncbi:MAG: MFS transporter [Actinobacteria bacterium]|nr:MFS transporter [Actinomycetota bacterium]